MLTHWNLSISIERHSTFNTFCTKHFNAFVANMKFILSKGMPLVAQCSTCCTQATYSILSTLVETLGTNLKPDQRVGVHLIPSHQQTNSQLTSNSNPIFFKYSKPVIEITD